MSPEKKQSGRKTIKIKQVVSFIGSTDDIRQAVRGLVLLEPAVGPGAVVAKVTAAFDSSDVETTADAYDPVIVTGPRERTVS